MTIEYDAADALHNSDLVSNNFSDIVSRQNQHNQKQMQLNQIGGSALKLLDQDIGSKPMPLQEIGTGGSGSSKSQSLFKIKTGKTKIIDTYCHTDIDLSKHPKSELSDYGDGFKENTAKHLQEKQAKVFNSKNIVIPIMKSNINNRNFDKLSANNLSEEFNTKYQIKVESAIKQKIKKRAEDPGDETPQHEPKSIIITATFGGEQKFLPN